MHSSCVCAEWREIIAARSAEGDTSRTLALAKGIGGFDADHAPAEWKQTGSSEYRSQFSSDYGSLTYECTICGSVIDVEWQDQDEYNERIRSLVPTSYYYVRRITAKNST